MKKIILISVGLWIILPVCFGQGEIDEQQRIFYRNEHTLGIFLNSTGWGVGYRYGKRINYLNKRLYEIDFNNIKHPKEYKTTNPYFPNTKGFIYGKENLFVNLRAGYGFQHEMFRKIDRGGISIRRFYSFGPSLGFYKPIYYELLVQVGGNTYTIEVEKFDENIHQATDIYSRASFFKGFDEIKFVPGVYGKAGVNFEYSKYDRLIHAIEIGLTFDAYLRKVPIMATEDNRQFFFSLFISYRFGKVVDPKIKDRDNEIEPFQNAF
ncbi:MAG: hypothetical protein JSV24_06935 [Bacteroidales bacterium]|nr:MAG: hypothetical protein JSV24_06935 [Bacteroidales bacterium]